MRCEAYHPELPDSRLGWSGCRPDRTRFVAEEEKIWYFRVVRTG